MKITINNNGDIYSGPWGFLAHVIVLTLAVIPTTYFLPDTIVRVDSLPTAILTAVVIALLNNFIRPILIVLTLPFSIVTMGLFVFIINAVIIMLASSLVPKFHVNGFGGALLFSLLLTAVNYLLEIPNRMMRRPKYQHSDKPVHDSHTDDDGFTPYEEIKDDTE